MYIIKRFIADRYESYALLFATCIALVWFTNQGIAFSADAYTYLQTAEYLVGDRPMSSYIYMRTIGYPLFLITCGFPFIKTFTIILLFQFLLAISIPIFMYRSIDLVIRNKKFALSSAVFTTLSLLPFYYAKSIGPEQLYMALSMYAVYRILRYYKEQTRSNLVILIFVLVCLVFTRPSANLFYVICMLFSMVMLRKHYILWLLGWGCYLILQGCISLSFSFDAHAQFSGSLYKKIGMAFFNHVYTNGFNEVGPYTKLLKSEVKNYAIHNPELRKIYKPEYLFTRFKNSELFADALFTQPNSFYFVFISDVLGQLVTNRQKFLYRFALEVLKDDPRYILSFLKTYIFSAGVSFAGQSLFFHSYVELPLVQNGISHDFRTGGPNNRKLYDIIYAYANSFPDNWKSTAQNANFSSQDSDRFMEDVIVAQPNAVNVWYMWNSVDVMLAPQETSAIFTSAALENFRQKPYFSALMFLNHMMYLTFGSTSNFYYGSQRIGLVNPFAITGDSNFLSSDPKYASMAEDIENSFAHFVTTDTNRFVREMWAFLWTILKISISCVIIAGFVLTVKNVNFKAVSLVILLWLSHLITCAVFGEPIARYSVQIMPIASFLAFTTYFEIRKFCIQNVKKPSLSSDLSAAEPVLS